MAQGAGRTAQGEEAQKMGGWEAGKKPVEGFIEFIGGLKKVIG